MHYRGRPKEKQAKNLELTSATTKMFARKRTHSFLFFKY